MPNQNKMFMDTCDFSDCDEKMNAICSSKGRCMCPKETCPAYDWSYGNYVCIPKNENAYWTAELMEEHGWPTHDWLVKYSYYDREKYEADPQSDPEFAYAWKYAWVEGAAKFPADASMRIYIPGVLPTNDIRPGQDFRHSHLYNKTLQDQRKLGKSAGSSEIYL